MMGFGVCVMGGKQRHVLRMYKFYLCSGFEEYEVYNLTMMENTVVGKEDVGGGGRDERTERGRKCFFPMVVLAEVEESGKKIQC
ncbi:hypothetical protein MTR_8g020580 [Medicago truncatula]|uniref:Uncharacterized protein n=2 Tax=Medicago truncatula TaxID=3880 RepID=G7L6U4_MEDTR|nr:hypothetical protein MTR_8g020580 [Medicago truncatula]